MKTNALRWVLVQLVVPASHLCSGPLNSGCKASQKTGMPGSPNFPCVALMSHKCSVALAASLATAAGAMYLKLGLKQVCVVNWMAECGVQRSFASTMSNNPAGPTTLCHGLSAADSLLRKPLKAV